MHPGRFSTYHQAREDRNSRLEELRRRWDEEHQKIKDLVQMLKVKAKYNDGMAPRYHAAQTRLRKFEEAGPPQETPLRQNVNMRLKGGRTAKRAVIAERLELTGLMKPFDLEIWFGERVAVLGSNGSGKSHFLRLVAAGGSDPDAEHRPVGDIQPVPVTHTGRLRLGSRVRPGWFAQTHEQPALVGRTLLEILHRGDEHRTGRPREEAARVLDRYGLARASEQTFDSLSGGQQARFQILLLELSGRDLPAARRADRQPRPALGRGAGGGARGVRGHRHRGDPRPVVRPGLRPVPGLRRRTAGSTSRTNRSGTRAGSPAPADRRSALGERGGRAGIHCVGSPALAG